ncbi:MAG TPA: nitrilase-related carbon-nitrogen hydrolase, partial [Salinisphaeraceae bacterium]|nr:nitrilase-related carbon-nitrogen hydrolase [Salinisphaeraceae bacterium]
MTTFFAAIQMSSTAAVADNLASADALLRQAAERGAQLAVLPENFALMAKSKADLLAAAEADGAGPIQDFLAATAQRLGLWVVAGSLPLAGPDAAHVRPVSLVYD